MTLKSYAATLALLFCSAASQAALINIQLLDVDVVYSGAGNNLRDATAIAGGNQNAVDSDNVVAANFELDGAQVASLMGNDLFADLLVSNLPSSLPNGVFQVAIGDAGGGFGFDFFSNDYSLELGIGTIDLLISPGVLFFTAPATVLSQDLPAGLQFGSTVQISYTATLPAVQLGATTSMAIASGVMTISGIAIPEPAALLLAAFGSVAACVRRR